MNRLMNHAKITVLTRDQVHMLSAGRELDALIAEKVMGLELVQDMQVEELRYWVPGSRKKEHKALPHYSTDMSAAWTVVEHMRKKHSNYIIIVYNEHLNYDVRFSGDKSREYIRLSSVTHAIGRAALLALL